MDKCKMSLFLLLLTLFAPGSTQIARTGTWYKEITNSIDNNCDIFNRNFHQCSLKEECSFVFRLLKSSVFTGVYDEKDLPTDRGGYTIWKKMRTAFRDCKDAQMNGMALWQGSLNLLLGTGSSTFRASCDMTTNGGGWIVIQRRVDEILSFGRNWTEYESGFGDPNGNHWLGLKTIHHLTQRRNVTLRFDLINMDGSHGFAEYDEFKLAGPAQNYSISIGKYRGNIGDSMTPVNGEAFMTKDRDDKETADRNCVGELKSGWWYDRSCSLASLYSWYTWKVALNDITQFEMKIRGRN